MRRISLTILLILLGFSIGNELKAQITTAVPFLQLAPDSRSGGMGESGTAIADNSAAIFWNPAGLAFQSGTEVSITHSNWLPQFNLDIFYDYLTYKQYMEDLSGTVSASITFMNFGEFVRTDAAGNQVGTFRSFEGALTLGYATKLSNDWGIGFNARLIHSRLSTQGTEGEEGSGVATSVSFDLATMWRPEKLNLPLIGNFDDRLSIGLNLSNVGPNMYYIDKTQADPLPTNLRLGFGIRLFQNDFNSLTYTLDFSRLLIQVPGDSSQTRDGWAESLLTSWGNDNMLKEIVTTMGLEYWYGKPDDFMFALRAGYFYEDPDFGNRKFITIGAGLRYDLYGFDFSYLTTSVFKNGENHPLNDTLRFTVLIGWGGRPQKSLGFPRGI